MNHLAVFIVVLCFHGCYGDDLLSIYDIDTSQPLNLTVEIPNGKNVTFTLYTGTNSSDYEQINNDTAPSSFLADQPLKIVTHGWRGSASGNSCVLVRQAYLTAGNVNLIVVDWSEMADDINYLSSAGYTYAVGNKIGEVAEFLMTSFGFNGSNVHLIGHSLGAHVMGYAGRWLKERNLTVAQITGLDPAAPLFEYPTLEGLLSSDADFVQVIHTNAGLLGISEPRGHVDFYPNGGGPTQPGCTLTGTLFESCAHVLSYKFFSESIVSGGFTSRQCGSFSRYRRGACDDNAAANMGANCSLNATGHYYLETNGEPVYSKG